MFFAAVNVLRLAVVYLNFVTHCCMGFKVCLYGCIFCRGVKQCVKLAVMNLLCSYFVSCETSFLLSLFLLLKLVEFLTFFLYLLDI